MPRSQVANINFWGVTPCSLVERDQHFVGTCYTQRILQMQMAGSSEVVMWHHFIEYCNLILTLLVRNPYVLESHIISKLL
jgi:hypothetical protein